MKESEGKADGKPVDKIEVNKFGQKIKKTEIIEKRPKVGGEAFFNVQLKPTKKTQVKAVKEDKDIDDSLKVGIGPCGDLRDAVIFVVVCRENWEIIFHTAVNFLDLYLS